MNQSYKLVRSMKVFYVGLYRLFRNRIWWDLHGDEIITIDEKYFFVCCSIQQHTAKGIITIGTNEPLPSLYRHIFTPSWNITTLLTLTVATFALASIRVTLVHQESHPYRKSKFTKSTTLHFRLNWVHNGHPLKFSSAQYF